MKQLVRFGALKPLLAGLFLLGVAVGVGADTRVAPSGGFLYSQYLQGADAGFAGSEFQDPASYARYTHAGSFIVHSERTPLDAVRDRAGALISNQLQKDLTFSPQDVIKEYILGDDDFAEQLGGKWSARSEQIGNELVEVLARESFSSATSSALADGFLRRAELDIESELGHRKANVGVEFIGALREGADDAVAWQLRGYAGDDDAKGVNVGLIYRRLAQGGLIGGNVFFDHETHEEEDFSRWSVGGEVRSPWVDVFANYYDAITDDVARTLTVVGGTPTILHTYSAGGYDVEANIHSPDVRWFAVAASYYNYEGKYGQSDDSGFRAGVKLTPPNSNLRLDLFHDSGDNGNIGGNLRWTHHFGEHSGGGRNVGPFDPRDYFFVAAERDHTQRIRGVVSAGGQVLRTFNNPAAVTLRFGTVPRQVIVGTQEVTPGASGDLTVTVSLGYPIRVVTDTGTSATIDYRAANGVTGVIAFGSSVGFDGTGLTLGYGRASVGVADTRGGNNGLTVVAPDAATLELMPDGSAGGQAEMRFGHEGRPPAENMDAGVSVTVGVFSGNAGIILPNDVTLSVREDNTTVEIRLGAPQMIPDGNGDPTTIEITPVSLQVAAGAVVESGLGATLESTVGVVHLEAIGASVALDFYDGIRLNFILNQELAAIGNLVSNVSVNQDVYQFEGLRLYPGEALIGTVRLQGLTDDEEGRGEFLDALRTISQRIIDEGGTHLTIGHLVSDQGTLFPSWGFRNRPHTGVATDAGMTLTLLVTINGQTMLPPVDTPLSWDGRIYNPIGYANYTLWHQQFLDMTAYFEGLGARDIQVRLHRAPSPILDVSGNAIPVASFDLSTNVEATAHHPLTYPLALEPNARQGRPPFFYGARDHNGYPAHGKGVVHVPGSRLFDVQTAGNDLYQVVAPHGADLSLIGVDHPFFELVEDSLSNSRSHLLRLKAASRQRPIVSGGVTIQMTLIDASEKRYETDWDLDNNDDLPYSTGNSRNHICGHQLVIGGRSNEHCRMTLRVVTNVIHNPTGDLSLAYQDLQLAIDINDYAVGDIEHATLTVRPIDLASLENAKYTLVVDGGASAIGNRLSPKFTYTKLQSNPFDSLDPQGYPPQYHIGPVPTWGDSAADLTVRSGKHVAINSESSVDTMEIGFVGTVTVHQGPVLDDIELPRVVHVRISDDASGHVSTVYTPDVVVTYRVHLEMERVTMTTDGPAQFLSGPRASGVSMAAYASDGVDVSEQVYEVLGSAANRFSVDAEGDVHVDNNVVAGRAYSVPVRITNPQSSDSAVAAIESMIDIFVEDDPIPVAGDNCPLVYTPVTSADTVETENFPGNFAVTLSQNFTALLYLLEIDGQELLRHGNWYRWYGYENRIENTQNPEFARGGPQEPDVFGIHDDNGTPREVRLPRFGLEGRVLAAGDVIGFAQRDSGQNTFSTAPRLEHAYRVYQADPADDKSLRFANGERPADRERSCQDLTPPSSSDPDRFFITPEGVKTYLVMESGPYDPSFGTGQLVE